MSKKCIYCGVEESEAVKFSESDIIPFSLKYSRILNKYVCQPEHNSKFSDEFESEVANELSIISNTLDIRTRKGYADYYIELEIDNEIYICKNFSSTNKLFIQKKAYRSKDDNYLIKSYDDLTAEGKTNITPININEKELVTHVKLPYDIFFRLPMFRLVTKIAFEWYCKENKIIDKDCKFESIINYITKGSTTETQTIVEIIDSCDTYENFDKIFSVNSHILFCFHDDFGNVFCIIALFNLVLYKVWLCYDYENLNCENRLFYLESHIDGSIDSKKSSCYNSALDELLQNPYVVKQGNTLLPIDTNHNNEYSKATILCVLYDIARSVNTCKSHNSAIQTIIFSRLENLLNTGVVHLRSLQRFVEEHNLSHKYNINESNTNGDFWFLLFVVFLIGKNKITNYSNHVLLDIVTQALPDKEFQMTSEKIIEIKNIITKSDNYKNHILIGALAILNMKNNT